MENEGLYLLTFGQILENTKNITNISLYYNRLSIINNLRKYENNYCWVHESKSNLERLPEVKCACASKEKNKECNLKLNIKCEQERYVKKLTKELNKKNLIIDFSSLQCISIIYKGRLYLYSNLSTCKNVNGNNYGEKDKSRGIICEECKIEETINYTKEEIEKAMYNIIEKGEDQKYGLTLMEHTSMEETLKELEKVQDSVRSIGILEGSILDDQKESNIDKINVIECDIILEDINTETNESKEENCTNCKYIKDLNNYLKIPINNYIQKEKENKCKNCEGNKNEKKENELEDKYMEECIKFAKELVEKANKELESICTSLITQVNVTCQPPLKIAIRFLEHFLSFEYIIEYTKDNQVSEKESIYEINTQDNQNVILHEFIQSNVITKQIIEEIFKNILVRIKSYIVIKTKEEEEEVIVEEKTPSPSNKNIYQKEIEINGYNLNETKLEESNNIYERSNVTSKTINENEENNIGDSNIETDNIISSDNDSYKNSYQELEQIEKENSSQELEEMIKKKEDNIEVEMEEMENIKEIYPYWWKFYVEDNTLGEGDINVKYEGIRRFTRSSYIKEESSTPKNKKTVNGANYLLTRCVSSDFSTKSNINVSGIHSSRETLCPSEFNQSQPTIGQNQDNLPCFCKNCIQYISNITRVLPNNQGELSTNIKNFESKFKIKELKEIKKESKNNENQEKINKREIYENNIQRYGDSNVSSFKNEQTNTKEEEIEKEYNIIKGLRRSIRAAREVATVIRKKINGEHKPLLDTLNVALLSSLRLGEYLFNNTNIYGIGGVGERNIDQTSTMDLDNRFEMYNEQINSYRSSNLDSSRSPELGLSNRSIESIERIKNIEKQREEEQYIQKRKKNGNESIIVNENDRIGNEKGNIHGIRTGNGIEVSEGIGIILEGGGEEDLEDGGDLEGDVGELIFMEMEQDQEEETNRSKFENYQYLAYDIVSEDDAYSYSSISSNSPKLFNKRKSPSRSRRSYRSFSSLEGMQSTRRSYEGLPGGGGGGHKRSYEGLPTRRSFEGLPSSRRSTRELPQDDMYIYDMNNLSDKGEFEDWYPDSDSSKKSTKYVQKRMPPTRPSVSNLTEIYGSQDMLIPMGPLPIGVYFDASRKLWRCQWRENGKFRTKGFSLGHYNTLADARHACILFRCQVGNMNIQPEWLEPNYIKVSDLLNRRSAQPSSTPKKSSRKKKRQEDLYEP